MAERRPDLDSFCARRRPKSAVGAEESLRRGRTKESAKARKKGLDGAPAHIIPIALAASQCPTSRDFVPWRFLDAGRRSAWIASSCRRPKTCTKSEVSAAYSITSSAEGKQCWRDVQAEHLGGLEIDHRFVLGGRLHWEVSRLLALEDANRRSLAARTGLGSGGESGH